MSGPIEYVILFEAMRRAQIRARLEQERQLRAERTREYLAASRVGVQNRIAAIQAARASRNQGLLERRRTQLQQAIQEPKQASEQVRDAESARVEANVQAAQFQSQITKAQEDIARLSETMGSQNTSPAIASLTQEMHDLSNSTAGPSESQSRLAALNEQITRVQKQVTQRTSQLAMSLEQVTQWRETLASHESVGQFESATAATWNQNADALLADYAGGLGLEEGLSRSQHLATEVEKIVNSAEELRAKYETRNLLLREVMDSLKAIGFFVSDPEFERPNDPTSPVLLKAVRGGEEMSASVDLSESIRSVWDGYEGEQCKGVFLDYMEQMKQRGISVTATKPAITERPILKQKGAKDLPNSHSQAKGK